MQPKEALKQMYERLLADLDRNPKAWPEDVHGLALQVSQAIGPAGPERFCLLLVIGTHLVDLTAQFASAVKAKIEGLQAVVDAAGGVEEAERRARKAKGN